MVLYALRVNVRERVDSSRNLNGYLNMYTPAFSRNHSLSDNASSILEIVAFRGTCRFSEGHGESRHDEDSQEPVVFNTSVSTHQLHLLMVRSSKLSMGFPPSLIDLLLFKERSLHNNDATQHCMEGCITCGNHPLNLNTTQLVRLFCEHQILK